MGLSTDLKQRIPTAIAYAIVIVGSLLLGRVTSIILMTTILLSCLYEFTNVTLASGSKLVQKISLLTLVIILLYTGVQRTWTGLTWTILLGLNIAFITINGMYLILKGQNLFTKWPPLIRAGLYIIMPVALSIYAVASDPMYSLLLLALFIIIWVTDAGAYFVGKNLGRTKLYPAISPHKTWEGMIGGGVLAFLVTAILSDVMGIFSFQTWMMLAFFVWVFAVLGDLVESAWKRQHGIKDTGKLLPGHGGFLDRLDSFLYCAPILALFYHYFL